MRGTQRNDFRFVIEGIALSQEQREEVARAVEEAGLRALNRVADVPATVHIDPKHLGRGIDWYGRYLRALARDQVKEQVQGIDYR